MGDGGGGGGSILPEIKPVDIGLGVATGGLYTSYQVANKGYNKLTQPARDARAATERLQKQQQDQYAQSKSDFEAQQKALADAEARALSDANQQNAKARQRKLAAGASGRSDTILTSPLGILAGVTNTAKKTLGGA